MKQKVKVWDLPTRLFHWLLVLSVGFMWYSAQAGGGMLVWHLRCGLLIVGLIDLPPVLGLLGQPIRLGLHNSCAAHRPSAVTCKAA